MLTKAFAVTATDKGEGFEPRNQLTIDERSVCRPSGGGARACTKGNGSRINRCVGYSILRLLE